MCYNVLEEEEKLALYTTSASSQDKPKVRGCSIRTLNACYKKHYRIKGFKGVTGRYQQEHWPMKREYIWDLSFIHPPQFSEEETSSEGIPIWA